MASFPRLSTFTKGLIVLFLWLFSMVLFVLITERSPWLTPWSPLLGTGFIIGSVWLGWAIRQAWVYPRRLLQAEALWHGGAYASDVVDRLEDVYVATG